MRVFIALLFVAVATAELAQLFENAEPVPGKYIIKLKDEFDVDEIAATVRLSGGHVGHIFRYVINAFAADLSDRVLDVVRNLPAVEYVQQEGVYRVQAESMIGDKVTWGLDRIDQRELPLNGAYKPRITGGGEGYTVWVIDTGVRPTHEEFKGKVGSRAKLVKNTVDVRDEDCNGHGTHCSGTVGSNTYGVANAVTIKAVKVLNCFGSGTDAGVIAGLDYVHRYSGNKDVASMSLGGFPSKALDSAVESLISKGVPTAVAAGNDNKDACNYSPARCKPAVTVGATANDDSRSRFSNYGTCVDIFAPGSNIKSLGHRTDTATSIMSGTSMACPHVAGAIALYGKDSLSMKKAETAVLNDATENQITDVQKGSPNKLLYV